MHFCFPAGLFLCPQTDATKGAGCLSIAYLVCLVPNSWALQTNSNELWTITPQNGCPCTVLMLQMSSAASLWQSEAQTNPQPSLWCIWAPANTSNNCMHLLVVRSQRVSQTFTSICNYYLSALNQTAIPLHIQRTSCWVRMTYGSSTEMNRAKWNEPSKVIFKMITDIKKQDAVIALYLLVRAGQQHLSFSPTVFPYFSQNATRYFFLSEHSLNAPLKAKRVLVKAHLVRAGSQQWLIKVFEGDGQGSLAPAQGVCANQ